MQNRPIIAFLEQIGLSSKEARVYFAALVLHQGNISQLAREAKLKRTTAYSVIPRLIKKGFIKTKAVGWREQYRPLNPVRISNFLSKREESLTKVLPEFEALFQEHKEESLVKYYEGLAGVETAFDYCLEKMVPEQDLLVLSDSQRWYDSDPEYFESFLRRREKICAARLIFTDTPFARKRASGRKRHNDEVRLFPPHTKLDIDLMIIPGRILVHQLVEPVFGILIEDRAVAEIHRDLFEIMWQAAPVYSAKSFPYER